MHHSRFADGVYWVRYPGFVFIDEIQDSFWEFARLVTESGFEGIPVRVTDFSQVNKFCFSGKDLSKAMVCWERSCLSFDYNHALVLPSACDVVVPFSNSPQLSVFHSARSALDWAGAPCGYIDEKLNLIAV